MFKRADFDSDNKLSRQEFEGILRQPMVGPRLTKETETPENADLN